MCAFMYPLVLLHEGIFVVRMRIYMIKVGLKLLLSCAQCLLCCKRKKKRNTPFSYMLMQHFGLATEVKK